jgi:hypothetical protein
MNGQHGGGLSVRVGALLGGEARRPVAAGSVM